VALSAVLTVYPPQSATAAHRVTPEMVEISGVKNRPGRLESTFLVDWDRLQHEDAEAAYVAAELWCQQRAYVVYRENDTYLFRGRIHSVTRTLIEGKPAVTIVALDKLQVLNETYSSFSGYYSFTRRGGATALSAVRLWPGYDYDAAVTTSKRTWYPDPASDAWLSTTYLDALSYKDTLAANINSSATEIKLSTSNKFFPPSGFVSIDSEWIQYNGYTWNQADGYWYLNNCRRAEPGILGTTAAAHLAAATVYPRIPKRIHDLSSILIEGDPDTTYTAADAEAIENANYEPNYEENSFTFNLEDPLNLGKRSAAASTAYGSLWATYSVCDEDNGDATALYLGADVITDLLEATTGNLGPGFAPTAPETCTANVTISPDIPITHFTVSKPEPVMNSLQRLLGDLGLNKGGDNDTIVHRYNPNADTLDVFTVAQKAASTADRRYHGEKGYTYEVNLDEVRNALIGWYTNAQNQNLVGPDRIWHPIAQVDGGGVPTSPVVTQKWNTAAAAHTWENHSAGSFAGDLVDLFYPEPHRLVHLLEPDESQPSLMTDNSADTGFGIWWTAAADAVDEVLYFWNPGATPWSANAEWLERVVLNLDLEGESESASKRLIDLTVYALLTFSHSQANYESATGAAPTVTLGDLGPKSRIIYGPGKMDYQTQGTQIEITVPAPVLCYGFAVKINQPLKATASGDHAGKYGIAINEAAAYSMPHKTQVLKSKATYATTDSNTVTAPNTHAKLSDANMGQYLVGLLSLGPATRQTALNLLFLQLLQNWMQVERHTYTIESTGIADGEGGGIPMPGETAYFASTQKTGVVEAYTYSVMRGRRSLTINATNYSGTLFGAAI
jgi:hypothetical protein